MGLQTETDGCRLLHRASLLASPHGSRSELVPCVRRLPQGPRQSQAVPRRSLIPANTGTSLSEQIAALSRNRYRLISSNLAVNVKRILADAGVGAARWEFGRHLMQDLAANSSLVSIRRSGRVSTTTWSRGKSSSSRAHTDSWRQSRSHCATQKIPRRVPGHCEDPAEAARRQRGCEVRRGTFAC
jgi:hypothetical protein